MLEMEMSGQTSWMMVKKIQRRDKQIDYHSNNVEIVSGFFSDSLRILFPVCFVFLLMQIFGHNIPAKQREILSGRENSKL